MTAKEIIEAPTGGLVCWLKEGYLEVNFSPELMNLGKGIFGGVANALHVRVRFRSKQHAAPILAEVPPSAITAIKACDSCSGTGSVPGPVGVRTCLACDGWGYAEINALEVLDELPTDELNAFYSRVMATQPGVVPERGEAIRRIRNIWNYKDDMVS